MRKAAAHLARGSLAVFAAGVLFAPGQDVAPACDPVQRVESIASRGESLPRLHSLLVSRRGELVYEQYFHGARATRHANIKSASKSILSALTGIAISRGLIAGVEVPIATFFPELAADPLKRQVTIEHLLTMQSGLTPTSNRNYGAWVASPNWVRYILSRPAARAPGLEMDYSTGNTHLLSAILSKAAKSNTWAFAKEALAEPLGFPLAQWPQDPQGIYFGGNDMLLTPRQMLRFGELYLHRGRIGSRQLIPESWLDATVIPRGHSRFSGRSYGYGWWIAEIAGVPAHYAWGFGGQYIIVLPALEMVVVSTSSPAVGEDRRGHRSAVWDLVENLIIAPAACEQGIITDNPIDN